MELLYFIIAQNIIWGAVTLKFYKAAGKPAWAAFVPFYNLIVALKIAQKPTWWFFLFIVPVVGTVMTVVLVYEFLHVFNYRKTWQTVLATATAGLYIGYLGYTEKIEYVGRNNAYIKAHLGEFVNAIFFAIVAATLIRSTTFEAYTIPTSSMEKSLMIGDFLFVSKMHYGVRIPMTPISLPLVHNKIPMTTTKSYLDFPKIPYLRLAKFQSVEKNDIVVFNYPEETMYPVDKRENYVKRCVAIAGDTLKIIDRQIYIDGEAQTLPDRSLGMFSYYVETNGKPLSKENLKEKYDITFIRPTDNTTATTDVYILKNPNFNEKKVYEYIVYIPTKKLDAFKAMPHVSNLIAINAGTTEASYSDSTYPKSLQTYLINYCSYDRRLFPNPQNVHGNEVVFKYTADNYGPLYIPAKGATIKFDKLNYYRYQKVITVHEGHTLKVKEGKFYVDDVETDSYTFEQDYYWMMGDNRHNSLDSRYWGFVPENHIVGKPVFIWMSMDWNEYKIRTDRVFTTVAGDGPRKSVFWYVFAVGVVGFGVSKWRKKRKK